MHTEQCFLTEVDIIRILSTPWTMQCGNVCDHDDNFLCEHRIATFASTIFISQPTCSPGSLD